MEPISLGCKWLIKEATASLFQLQISDLCSVDGKGCSQGKVVVASVEGRRSNWIRGHLKRK